MRAMTGRAATAAASTAGGAAAESLRPTAALAGTGACHLATPDHASLALPLLACSAYCLLSL